MVLRGLMISVGEVWLPWRSTAHLGPESISSPHYLIPLFAYSSTSLNSPNTHASACSARWIWGSPLRLLRSFSVLIAPPESQRGLYVRFYLRRRTVGKLNEASTWEQPHLNFSRGCSGHIRGNISNVQNKWRDVKSPKDSPPPATLSCCHKSPDPSAHRSTQTSAEKCGLSRARFPAACKQCKCQKEAFHFSTELQMWAAFCLFAKGFSGTRCT